MSEQKCPRHYPIDDSRRENVICWKCGKVLSERYLQWRRTKTANLLLKYAKLLQDYAEVVNQAYPEIDTTLLADTRDLEECAAQLKTWNKRGGK